MILRKNNGFTLIEVIVSIAIIAMIGVILSGFVSTTIKARNISHDRLKTLALCTSYLNEMKSVQNDFNNEASIEEWLDDEGFTAQSNYFKKTENNINLKVYINKNLEEPGLFELTIVGKSVNASELSISTVIKGGD
jgi:prepilin-type N-terminal cleavage/methylation domain-containing protein